MYAYFIRHGIPKSEIEDPKKSLSDKGVADIHKLGRFVAEHRGINVRTIHHSGKLRAKQTAEVLAEYLKPTEGLHPSSDLNPLDDISIWVDRLSDLNEDTMVVGHLPFLGKLIAYLICHDENREVIRFQAGQMVCLKKDKLGVWSIQWAVNPADL